MGMVGVARIGERILEMNDRKRRRIVDAGIVIAFAVGGISGVAAYIEPLWALPAVLSAIALILLFRFKNRSE